MSKLGKYSLPKGWGWATIPELVGKNGVFIDGDWVESKDQDPQGGVRLIQLADVGDGVYRDKSSRFLTREKAKELGCTFLKEGDVLIARMPDPLGRACVFPGDSKPSVTVVDVCIVRSANGEFDHRWLACFVNAHPFRSAISGLQAGSTRKRISRGNLATIPLPVPPLSEQRRIVGEIEKQFSRLEEGVGALKRVRANLKCYRAAVLKAACEGRLVPTEAERQRAKGRGTRGGGEFETGEELLARILAERRKNWQGKGPYKEPAPPNTAKYGSIPAGWIVASLEQLTSPERPICYGILMPKENVANGVLFVTVKDMKGDKIDLDSLRRTAPEIAMKYERASLKTGDLLLSIRGTYGRVAEVPKELDGGNITQDTARLDVTRMVSHRYIATYLRNPDCQQYFKRVARGVAVKGVNIGDVRPAPISLPPLAEQVRIVAEVERRLSVVEELEATVDANLQRATRLRQSMLQKAFEGKLK